MNFWGFQKCIFSIVEEEFERFKVNYKVGVATELYIPTIVECALQRGESIEVIRTNAQWFGLTYLKDKSDVVYKLNQLIQSGEYPTKII